MPVMHLPSLLLFRRWRRLKWENESEEIDCRSGRIVIVELGPENRNSTGDDDANVSRFSRRVDDVAARRACSQPGV